MKHESNPKPLHNRVAGMVITPGEVQVFDLRDDEASDFFEFRAYCPPEIPVIDMAKEEVVDATFKGVVVDVVNWRSVVVTNKWDVDMVCDFFVEGETVSLRMRPQVPLSIIIERMPNLPQDVKDAMRDIRYVLNWAASQRLHSDMGGVKDLASAMQEEDPVCQPAKHLSSDVVRTARRALAHMKIEVPYVASIKMAAHPEIRGGAGGQAR